MSDPLSRHLASLEVAAGIVAAGGLLLGFLTSIGARLLPLGPPSAAWWLHPALAAAGAATGLAAAARGRQIDRERWRIVEDPLLTQGERQHAHREAERRRRVAATLFLLAPVSLAYWLAYQFGGGEGGSAATYLLIVPPLVGFTLGLWLGNRLGGDRT